LITADEVKKAARNKGFPAGVVEKDYAGKRFLGKRIGKTDERSSCV